ncbi:hypothetical protein T4B_11623 [Trichinella pseudospiralis]|uniref:Uncharacterized protein n=1 Tax=Trichinella pseudospiralis TaxID=6337 RepID=A0A0V1JZU1_TRIPS|nr:hypothetical protein T4B_11623 [Trichinella pseudospiralis]KRZ40491.1 hypothetical protein T4C_2541 [Trichinella pseudospiralis]
MSIDTANSLQLIWCSAPIVKHWVQSSNRAQTLKQSREDLEEQLQFLNIRSPNKSSSQLHGHKVSGKATMLPLRPKRNPKGDGNLSMKRRSQHNIHIKVNPSAEFYRSITLSSEQTTLTKRATPVIDSLLCQAVGYIAFSRISS